MGAGQPRGASPLPPVQVRMGLGPSLPYEDRVALALAGDDDDNPENKNKEGKEDSKLPTFRTPIPPPSLFHSTPHRTSSPEAAAVP